MKYCDAEYRKNGHIIFPIIIQPYIYVSNEWTHCDNNNKIIQFQACDNDATSSLATWGLPIVNVLICFCPRILPFVICRFTITLTLLYLPYYVNRYLFYNLKTFDVLCYIILFECEREALFLGSEMYIVLKKNKL